MKRLTCNKLNKLTDGCYFVNFASREEATKYRMLAESAPKYEVIYKKLAEYENAEEQGLLLRLPCPFGTKIYCIHNGFIEEGMFFEMSCFKFKDYYKKSWFLTKEEAEQALLEKGKNND